MTLHGFYINLDRSPERRERMESEISRAGIDWLRRFPAIDGQTVTPGAQCMISPGELACFLSHTTLIEQAPADAYTVVLEDDVLLSPDLPGILRPSQFSALADYDIVFLDCQPGWTSELLLRMWDTLRRQLVDPRDLLGTSGERRIRGVDFYPAEMMYCWGLQAYMVTPKGQKSLPLLFRATLDRGPPGPIDILVRHALEDGRIKGICMLPFLATPHLESHVETTMEGRRQATDKLAVVSAIRRSFFAGNIDGLVDYVNELRPPASQDPVGLLSQLVGQVFDIEARQGAIVIG